MISHYCGHSCPEVDWQKQGWQFVLSVPLTTALTHMLHSHKSGWSVWPRTQWQCSLQLILFLKMSSKCCTTLWWERYGQHFTVFIRQNQTVVDFAWGVCNKGTILISYGPLGKCWFDAQRFYCSPLVAGEIVSQRFGALVHVVEIIGKIGTVWNFLICSC